MATAYGVNYTKYNSTPSQMVEVGQWGGRVRTMMDTATGVSFGTSEYLYVGRLPKGATIVMASVDSDATGTLNLKLDNVDADGASSQDAIWTGVVGTAAVTQIGYGGTKTLQECDVYITSSTAVSSKYFKSVVFYTVD